MDMILLHCPACKNLRHFLADLVRSLELLSCPECGAVFHPNSKILFDSLQAISGKLSSD